MNFKKVAFRAVLTSLTFVITYWGLSNCTGHTNSQEESPETFQPNSTRELIQYWKENYRDQVLSAYTFTQETVRFRDGKAQEPAIWQEAVQYPSYFRIDLPKTEEGYNINLNRNDSVYVLRKGVVVDSSRQIQQFMIMEGSMYFDDIDTTLAKLQEVGIAANLFTKSQYQDRPVYIIGAKEGDLSVPQIWLDAEGRYNVRRFSKTGSGKLLEVRYSEFKTYEGHWMEHWLEFLVDGKLVQTERYKDIDIHPKLSAGTFDRNQFMTHFWY
ncbi:MAG: hypothetical protein KTR30_07310 [Saprospiraceae bacterium]|nr:hypothetical protein [Saprospiraceae bacterium]